MISFDLCHNPARQCDYLHFTDKQIEVKTGFATSSELQRLQVAAWYRNPGLSDPNPHKVPIKNITASISLLVK